MGPWFIVESKREPFCMGSRPGVIDASITYKHGVVIAYSVSKSHRNLDHASYQIMRHC